MVRVLASKKIRFGLVGLVNTGVDFSILFILARIIGLPVIVANVISTSCSMTVSYLLNKKAVFGNTDKNNKRQVALFVIVTLTGLWGLQSLIIMIVSELLRDMFNSDVILLVAKLLATVASLIWNYILYSRVVFRGSR